MARRHPFVRTPLAAAVAVLAALGGSVHAQQQQLAPVAVTGRSVQPSASVSGWGDLPSEKLPLAATVVSQETLRDAGARSLGALVALDPGVADAYNSEGYYNGIAVRGFVLDNRFNFRRDGLPINAETLLPLENKQRIEVLKGTSGLQAGTSAPGGLVNLVVKRPTGGPLREAGIEVVEDGSLTGRIDLSQRFGSDERFGLRLNAAVGVMDPQLRDARGDRHLLAGAGEWKLAPGSTLEAEFETGRQRQPSQPGFSLRGDTLPAPADPRINLNNQPWSLPVVFDADTASLRWTQQLGADWRFTAHAMTQRLRTDDRVAFPFGCYDAATDTYYADRYCPDGSFDLYDYRSENERRRSDALELAVNGSVQALGLTHTLGAGVLRSRFTSRFQRQAFNYAGGGRDDGSVLTPANAELTDENTHRDEATTEFFLRDAIAFTPQWTAWFGARHVRLDRRSVRTDGSRATAYTQSFTTPFAAVSWAFAPEQLAYASASRGVESDVAPNRVRYTNAGEALPALTSRQLELGLRGRSGAFDWNLAAFDITRPAAVDIGTCDDDGSCTRRIDGDWRHRGIEAATGWRIATLTLRAGGQWLRARREGSVDAASNGLAPANVPRRTLQLQAAWQASAALALNARLLHQGERFVLPDNGITIPGWTTLDAGLRFSASNAVTLRAGVDNLLDKRAWRESPYQFSHAWLYPLAPRTLRFSVEASL
jgi:iron complex outermembrane receptor protein